MAKTIRLKSLPELPKRSEEANDRLVKEHQKKLVRIQQALLFTGERAVVVFEMVGIENDAPTPPLPMARMPA